MFTTALSVYLKTQRAFGHINILPQTSLLRVTYLSNKLVMHRFEW